MKNNQKTYLHALSSCETGRTSSKINEGYNHKFSLRAGEIIHINGIPCEYLGRGNFGTNTYPGRPSSVER